MKPSPLLFHHKIPIGPLGSTSVKNKNISHISMDFVNPISHEIKEKSLKDLKNNITPNKKIPKGSLSKTNKENSDGLVNKFNEHPNTTRDSYPASTKKITLGMDKKTMAVSHQKKSNVLFPVTPSQKTEFSTKSKKISIKEKAKEEDGIHHPFHFCKKEYFSYSEEKPMGLSNDEKNIYGDRELRNYTKIKLLGKGGCGIVWQCADKNGTNFAVKQISKKSKIDSITTYAPNSSMIAKKEIDILHFLNSKNVNETSEIIYLHDFYEDCNDIWLVFEIGGMSLANLSFKIQGEFYNNQRVYSIKRGKFLGYLMSDLKQFKVFIKQMLRFISFLNENLIVHGDLKPDNILIDYVLSEDMSRIKTIKIIDFGSAFYLSNPENFSSNTPEYMSPEIIELFERKASAREFSNFLKTLVEWPWCIDMWSLGVTLLEMVLSCPLWMSYTAKVIINGKVILKTGLFGVKGRNGAKIHSKQKEVSGSISKLLRESLITDDNEKSKLESLLNQMLDINYKKRISPQDALNHSFLKE